MDLNKEEPSRIFDSITEEKRPIVIAIGTLIKLMKLLKRLLKKYWSFNKILMFSSPVNFGGLIRSYSEKATNRE